MANLLNNASLLLNPAGSTIAYKEDKIYSVLPSNGSGDWNRTGGDGGTRINQDGYIEVTPANVVSYSSDLSNAYWTKRGFAQLSTTETAPDGSPTAYKVQENNTDNNPGVVVIGSTTPVGTYTFYVWLKADANVSFALSTVGNVVGTTINVTTSWQLFQVTQTLTSPSNGPHIGGFATIPRGSGIVLYIWHPQLNLGSTARPYQPTTDRLNYPRITYENGRGALITEPARTNINTYSTGPTGSFTTTGTANSDGKYFYSKAVLNNKTSLSPDGTNNAYEMLMHSSSYDMYTRFNGLTVGASMVYSIYVKLGTARNFCVVVNNTAAWNTITGSVFTAPELSDQHYTRVDVPFTVDGNGQVNVHLGGHSETMTQQDQGTVYLYGGQMEVGSYLSSYIPTTTAAVTRTDEYSATINSFQTTGVVPNGESWAFIIEGDKTICQTQGFAYYGSGTYLGGHYGTTFIYKNAANGEVYPFAITQPRFRIGVSWDSENLIIYQNGQQQVNTTNVLAAYDNFSQIRVGDGSSKMSFPKIAVFPNHLSPAQLEELTTFNSGSGGSISYHGPFTIHTFTTSGTFTPSFTGVVEVLVVAGGGGGGGWYYAGGGGAGGVLYASSFGVSQGTGITVTVGAGGAQQTGNSQAGNDGSVSSFGGLTALGGGGGGGGYASGPAGRNGGSGGGGGRGNSYSGGLGTPGQGNNGGGYYGWAGGGGGAGEVGSNGYNNANPGNGGDGLPYSITGFSTYYGGGGAGAVDANIDMPETVIPQGGLGGGGNGATYTNLNTAAGAGVTNTGGGGGGGCHAGANPTGAAGGSGIVIVRYLT